MRLFSRFIAVVLAGALAAMAACGDSTGTGPQAHRSPALPAIARPPTRRDARVSPQLRGIELEWTAGVGRAR